MKVQYLRLYAFNAGAWVQPMAGELRSPMPRGAAREEREREEREREREATARKGQSAV